MADVVDTFRRLVLLIARWVLVCVLAVAALAAVGTGIYFAHNYWTYSRHAAKVTHTVAVGDWICKDSKFPVFVGFQNNSSRRLESVSFYFVARRQGRSSDIAGFRSVSIDNIIKPNESFGHCWLPTLQYGTTDDPKTLEWSIRDVTYQFGD